MALFERNEGTATKTSIVAADAATRALSVTAVETDFVAGVYEKLASVYDIIFGPTLHPGRLQALQRMAIAPGDRVLEVGVGTGINLALYPPRLQRHRHRPVGLDAGEGARARARRTACATSALLQMDASALTFPDDSFDIVYAPYLISVVPDPVAVVARDAPGVPAGRPHHHPESLPQREPAALVGRALDLAVHRSHRLQVGPRPAGVPRAGGPDAGVDREGEHPARSGRWSPASRTEVCSAELQLGQTSPRIRSTARSAPSVPICSGAAG